jgi:hypothetical protein
MTQDFSTVANSVGISFARALFLLNHDNTLEITNDAGLFDCGKFCRDFVLASSISFES